MLSSSTRRLQYLYKNAKATAIVRLTVTESLAYGTDGGALRENYYTYSPHRTEGNKPLALQTTIMLSSCHSIAESCESHTCMSPKYGTTADMCRATAGFMYDLVVTLQVLPPLANRCEGSVRAVVETSFLGDPQLDTIQTSVARHDGPRAVLEADLGGVLEGVVDELGAVRRSQFDALWVADDGVPYDDVVLHPPGIYHPR